MVISDLQGKKILETEVVSGTRVDLASINKGVYVAQVYLKDAVQSQRFVVE